MLYHALTLGLIFLFIASPYYLIVGPTSLLIAPAMLLLLLRLLLEFVPINRFPPALPPKWWASQFRMLNNLIYGSLFYKLLKSRILESDWVLESKLFSVRRIWTEEELLNWVQKYHTLRPGLPRAPLPKLEELIHSSGNSLHNFQALYIEFIDKTLHLHQILEPMLQQFNLLRWSILFGFLIALTILNINSSSSDSPPPPTDFLYFDWLHNRLRPSQTNRFYTRNFTPIRDLSSSPQSPYFILLSHGNCYSTKF